MLCDHCGEHEAIIHLTQIVNNQMSTFHLCEKCAAEKGLEPGVSVGNFPLTDFLAQMGKGLAPERGEPRRPVRSAGCGWRTSGKRAGWVAPSAM